MANKLTFHTIDTLEVERYQRAQLRGEITEAAFDIPNGHRVVKGRVLAVVVRPDIAIAGKERWDITIQPE